MNSIITISQFHLNAESRTGEIDQKKFGADKEKTFLNTYQELVTEYNIDLQMPLDTDLFLKKWYLPGVKAEIDFVYSKIRPVEDTYGQH